MTSLKLRKSLTVVIKQDKQSEAAVLLKNQIYRNSFPVSGQKEGLSLRKLKMIKYAQDPIRKVQKLSIGTPDPSRETKVVFLVGATRTGKTTLVNAMVNFIYRIEFEDDFRLILLDETEGPERHKSCSQTDFITAYVFNHCSGMPFEYNFILVDTPGFGDTRGIKRDRELMVQMETFLKQDYGFVHVDLVGIVAASSAAALDATQKYIFDGLLSMFGKDVKENICIMATFSDAKKPHVVDALEEANVKFSYVYKFNNSALFACNKPNNQLKSHRENCDDSDTDEDDDILSTKLYWTMGVKSMNKFFRRLEKICPPNLTLTKEVLESRRNLQGIVVDLQNKIQMGLSKLSILHKERDMVSRIKYDIESCANYEEEVDVLENKKIDLNKNECITNCNKCMFTCHYPCHLPKGFNKERCASMKHGICKVCPGKCTWEVHLDEKFRYERIFIKEKRTIQQLFSRYNLAIHKLEDKSSIVQKIEDEIKTFVNELIVVIKTAQNHIDKLEEISLRHNPMSTIEYIDLLIEGQKMEKKENYLDRIKMLKVLKREVAIIIGVTGYSDAVCSGGEQLLMHFKKLLVDDEI